MINIESLKKYIGKISKEEFMELAKKIYNITDFICTDYPSYKEWYFKKQIPRIFTPHGEILFARSEDDKDTILAMACLKKDEKEKKICTIYVCDQVRGQHLGTSLIDASMEFLGTTKPLITIADYKLPMFQRFIDKYGWELTEVVSEVYNKHTKELCYNGTLTKDKEAQTLTLTKNIKKNVT